MKLSQKINEALSAHDKKVRPNAGGKKYRHARCVYHGARSHSIILLRAYAQDQTRYTDGVIVLLSWLYARNVSIVIFFRW